MGALAGVLGSMMALEAIREIVGFGEGLVGRLLMVDARAMRFETLRYARDPANPLNGDERGDCGFERARVKTRCVSPVIASVAKQSQSRTRGRTRIASSQELLAMTGEAGATSSETTVRLHHGEPAQRDPVHRRDVKSAQANL